ncbi:MAG: hypothetical protein JJ975_01645 [Bacteroidia bacterium]|nr:hypothetical protein [Bacteroidia bacterium]
MKLFFAKPEWTPKDVGYLPNQFKTDEKGNRLPHVTPMKKSFGVYMLINSLLSLVMFVSMFAMVEDPKRVLFRDLIDNKHLLVLVLVILFSVLTHGLVLDNKRGSKLIDTLRLACIAVALPFVYSGMVGPWFNPAVWIYCAVMVVWLWLGRENHVLQSGYVKTQAVG